MNKMQAIAQPARIFKVISLTRRQPIYLYKPVRQPPPPPVSPQRHPPTLPPAHLRKLTQQQINTPLQQRSMSCDLPPKKSVRALPAPKQPASLRQSKQSIREYLRLAYRRSEQSELGSGRSGRKDRFRPPILPPVENVEEMSAERMGMSNNEQLRALAQMRRRMRRSRQSQARQQDHTAFEYSLKADMISAWDSNNQIDDF